MLIASASMWAKHVSFFTKFQSCKWSQPPGTLFFFSRLLFNLIWNLAGKASGCLRSVALVLWQLKSTYILVVIIIHMIFLPPLCWFCVLLWPINCDKCTGNYHSTAPAPYSGCYRVCCLAASAVVLLFLFSREPVISELQCVFNWLFP